MLDGTRETGRAQKAIKVQQAHQRGADRPDIAGEPVALRWTTHPDLGFPRRPFEVWRRPRNEKTSTRLGSGRPINVSSTPQLITWTQGEMYDVQFDANPLAGSALVVEALDLAFHVIPGQRIEFTGAARGAFRCPGIAALRVSGSGAVADVRGNTQHAVANAADWERRQVVGLPFDKGEIALPDYDALDQGYETPSLNGLEAALMRLDIARTLRLPLPPTGVADIPTPTWDGPDPAGFLNSLRTLSPALVRLIGDCLAGADDTDPLRMQVLFEVQATLPGIRQMDIPGGRGTDPTVMELPVVAISMLSAGSDSEAASALGYGTVEFWEHSEVGQSELVYPPGAVRTRFDYMVTASYMVPFQGSLDLAALTQLLPPPAPPSALQTAHLQRNRAPAIDKAATEAVQVSWALSELPAGFGVLRSLGPGDAAILNAPRKAGGHDPFIPQRPDPVDGVPPAGVRTVFTDPVSVLPLNGSATTRYMALALDVFARWSPWRLIASTASADPVQVPGLVAADLKTDVMARTGRIVPGTLEVDVVWDWSDRSPDRLHLTGSFIGAAAQPPASAPTSVPFGPGGPVVIRFTATGAPFIDSGHTGTVSLVPQPTPGPGLTPPEGDRRQYHLRLTGLSCDFTTAGEVALAVWVHGAETVRPTELSAQSDPRVARAPDPIPPPPPVLPAIDLQWTALPDATGRARAVLTWPDVAGATGYIVWEATEAALRRAVAPGVADPPPTDDVLTRAGALRALVTGSADAQARSLIAFSRVRDRPFAETRLELALPGAADSLYAYRVSAVTAANVESARSDTVALVAVPRRIVPGRPTLMLRPAVGGGVDVIAVPGRGPRLAGLRVHRVRRAGLAQETGMMGPAAIAESDPGWRAVTVPRRPGETTGDSGLAVTDPVEASWYPYHYRVVAVGQADPPNGGIPGESDPSAVASIVLAPTAGPMLDSVDVAVNANNRVVRFRTDLPVRESPVGQARITVIRIAAPTPGARLERTAVLSVAPQDVQQGALLEPLPSPTAAQLAAMPEIRRGAPDAQGRCTYSVRVRTDLTAGVVVVCDPLGRSLEQTLPEVT
ncbi:hypothetical protein [Streptomyces sp. NPDC057280]|uniref:hypothetical protein n=1 Tax=Streptomyces sp. NPDC057280 TaxID=3346081 RepID=UPI0036389EAB